MADVTITACCAITYNNTAGRDASDDLSGKCVPIECEVSNLDYIREKAGLPDCADAIVTNPNLVYYLCPEDPWPYSENDCNPGSHVGVPAINASAFTCVYNVGCDNTCCPDPDCDREPTSEEHKCTDTCYATYAGCLTCKRYNEYGFCAEYEPLPEQKGNCGSEAVCDFITRYTDDTPLEVLCLDFPGCCSFPSGGVCTPNPSVEECFFRGCSDGGTSFYALVTAEARCTIDGPVLSSKSYCRWVCSYPTPCDTALPCGPYPACSC